VKLFEAQSQYIEKARLLTIIVLLTLISHAAAVLTWQLCGPVLDSGDVSLAHQTATGKKVPGKRAISKPKGSSPPGLLLFGKAEKQVEKAPATKIDDSTSAPKTTLQLELKGVIAFKPDAKALAIIREKGKKAEDKVYGIGDKVPGNAEVRGIYPDRVILSRSGKYETLLMTEKTEKKSSKGKRSSRRRASRRSSGGITSSGDGKNWQIDKSYWKEKISDIPALAKEVGVEVYKQGGKQVGYKLNSSSGGKLLSDLGLNSGDVIYEVNGIKMTNASQGLTAYKRIKNAPRISLVVGKGGGPKQTRSYKIQ